MFEGALDVLIRSVFELSDLLDGFALQILCDLVEIRLSYGGVNFVLNLMEMVLNFRQPLV